MNPGRSMHPTTIDLVLHRYGGPLQNGSGIILEPAGPERIGAAGWPCEGTAAGPGSHVRRGPRTNTSYVRGDS